MAEPGLTFKVQEPVDAVLIVRTKLGTERPATEADLKLLGFTSDKVLRERMKKRLALLGDDDEAEPLSTLRYFIEYITTYDFDIEADAVAAMKALLWPETRHRSLAEAVAARLFTDDASRQKAIRLALETEDGLHNLGGWCERAVADLIERTLAEEVAHG